MISHINRQQIFLAFAMGFMAVNANPVLVDLSQDFDVASTFNQNSGAASIQELASQNDLIRTVVVIENGQVVADYTKEGVDASRPYAIWSATKSWTGLLMGMLVQDGLLRIDETLGDVFDDPSDWAELSEDELEFKQAVTIEEMLTMTSGLHMPDFFKGATSAEVETETFSIKDDIGFAWYDGGVMGGANVSHALADPEVAQQGSKKFRYLPANNILSYVTKKRTGMTPREYLSANVLSFLGIKDEAMNWWQNEDGVEYGYHGLSMTPLQMAKWGQLYLQGGKSDADTQLLDQAWVEATSSLQAGNMMYGYLTWVYEGEMLQQPELGEFFCASGMGGQNICVSRSTGRVVVQQRDLPLLNPAKEPAGTSELDITMLALDPAITFRA